MDDLKNVQYMLCVDCLLLPLKQVYYFPSSSYTQAFLKYSGWILIYDCFGQAAQASAPDS